MGGISQERSVAREKGLWISEPAFCARRKKGSCMLGWQAVGWLIQDNDARWTAGGEGWLREPRSLA